MDAVPGVILAGGRASRMGGGDKGERLIAGASLMERVIARLGPQCDGLAINANGEPARLAAYGLPLLPDTIADHPGPLAGVLAGLDWAAHRGADAVVTVAVDTPFVPRDLVARLQASAGDEGLALAASPGADGVIRRHPTCGLWPVALREDLRAAVQGGLGKIVLWTDRYGAGRAEWPSTPVDPFFNVNTPEDLAEAERLAAILGKI
ncbi:molybdenum cofactor guanylyltransferase MobA (plasmid) [Paracoccus sp. TK19116]|uniref:Molybdenum cofactor guanylyltransferase n=1 Tax=Paracoccus albicereus TaxID=2922394 RepID=A0ABT1MLB3_9RHOB|nr:molybdenum cofactor guanylyltransferase MobA [Paracoccus albicereus]MCQ0969089.1 molybdenum cofactor guanylyltransferase MobA [Paracoccus albicereus]